MTEKELVAKARGGDFQAFTELIDAHKNKIYALVRKLTGNTEDAEDIVQETFLRAIDKIDQFRGDASFGTWLYTIALNLTRAQYAKQKQADLQPMTPISSTGATRTGFSNPTSSVKLSTGSSMTCRTSTARRSSSAISRSCRSRKWLR